MFNSPSYDIPICHNKKIPLAKPLGVLSIADISDLGKSCYNMIILHIVKFV